MSTKGAMKKTKKSKKMQPKAVGGPIPFIQSVNGEFQVDQKAQKLLDKITGKVAIICVAGPYRTGKSFLLNRLIGRQNGFQVGSTVKACTKGIWLWGEPIKQDGITYVFLDSEGLGSIEQSQTFDTQIFSLAVLLSSLFVLNTQGTINESALEQLDLVVECAKQIQVDEDEKSDARSLAEHFPNFMWVLRDFTLQLKNDDGEEIDSQQYLEECLQPQKGSRKGVAEKNRIRNTIKTVFPNRDCVTMVRPILDEEKLQKLYEMPYEDLRKKFREQMQGLQSRVYEFAKAKAIDGAYVNGACLVGLAKQYTNAINTGAVPTIHSAWNSVVQVQGQEALKRALKVFSSTIDAAFPSESTCLEEEELAKIIETAEAKALGVIKKRAVGTAEFQEALAKTMCVKVGEVKATRSTMNRLVSRDLCQRCIEQAWEQGGMEEKMADASSVEQFHEYRQGIVNQFNQRAVGPCKEQVKNDFLVNKDKHMIGIVFAKTKALAQETKRVEKELARKEKTFDKEIKTKDATINKQEITMQRLESKNVDIEKEKKGLQREITEAQKMALAVQGKHQKTKFELDKAKSALEDAKAAHLKMQKQHEADMNVLSLKLKEESATRKSESKAKKEFKNRAIKSEEKSYEITNELTSAVAKLDAEQKKNSAIQKELATSERHEEDLRSKLQVLEEDNQELKLQLKDQAGQLKNQAGSASESSAAYKAQSKAMKTLKKRAIKSEEKSDEITNELTSAVAKLDKEQTKHVSIQKELATSKKQEKNLRSELQVLEEDNQELTSAVAKLNAEQIKNGSNKKELATSKKQGKDLRSKLQVLEEDNQELKLQLKNQSGSASQSSASYIAAEEENKHLKEALERRDADEEEAHLLLCRQVQTIKGEKKQLESRLAEALDKINALEEATDISADLSPARPKELTPEELMQQMLGRRSDRENRAPASSEQKAPKKPRSRKPPLKEIQPDMCNDDENESEDEDDEYKQKRSEVERRRVRRSIMPPTSNNVENPAKCTIQQLRSWLTDLNVDFPQKPQKKQFYIDLLYCTEPLLEGAEVPCLSKKKTKKRR